MRREPAHDHVAEFPRSPTQAAWIMYQVAVTPIATTIHAML